MPKIKMKKQKYDLFLCHNCKNITAYRKGTGDGHKCPICNSPIFVCIGTYKFDKF